MTTVSLPERILGSRVAFPSSVCARFRAIGIPVPGCSAEVSERTAALCALHKGFRGRLLRQFQNGRGGKALSVVAVLPAGSANGESFASEGHPSGGISRSATAD